MSGKRRDQEEFLRNLFALDRRLGQHGFPVLSPRWKREIARFYRSGKRRFVIRKGRRAGASTIVAPLLAVAEMLYGGHVHSKGSPPLVFAFVSVRRGEAANRLRGVRERLDVVGEAYDARSEEIELVNRPAIFKVVSANFRMNVGDEIAWAWADEVPLWVDEATSANPAEQVIANFIPALATMPDATLWLVGSPQSETDYHAQQFALGETEQQCVMHAATWELNPTLSEAQTRALQPDPREWSRNFAAIPQASVTAAFNFDWEHVIVPAKGDVPYLPGSVEFITFDSGAIGGGKSWSVATSWLLRWKQLGDGGPVVPCLRCTGVRTLKPLPVIGVSLGAFARTLRGFAHERRVTHLIFGDRDNHSGLAERLVQDGIVFPVKPVSMDLGRQAARSTALIDRMKQGTIEIPDHPDLLDQLRRAKLVERGNKWIICSIDKRKFPDDLVDCVLLACDVELTQGIPVASVDDGRGTLRKIPARIVNRGGGDIAIVGEDRWVREYPNGDVVSATTPRTDPGFEAARAARWKRGISTPEDHEEFGDEELFRLVMAAQGINIPVK